VWKDYNGPSYIFAFILGVVKRNPLFLREIEWENNEFLFTTPNICFVTVGTTLSLFCDRNLTMILL